MTYKNIKKCRTQIIMSWGGEQKRAKANYELEVCEKLQNKCDVVLERCGNVKNKANYE